MCSLDPIYLVIKLNGLWIVRRFYFNTFNVKINHYEDVTISTKVLNGFPNSYGWCFSYYSYWVVYLFNWQPSGFFKRQKHSTNRIKIPTCPIFLTQEPIKKQKSPF